MSRRPSAFAVLPVAVVALAVAGFVVWSTRDDDVAAPTSVAPVAVTAAGPSFATVAELAAASDRIVVVAVEAVGAGRTIADPGDPDAGIVTQLVTARVERALDDGATGTLVIEQESTLLDGTPIVVNGLPPLTAGDQGVAFLVAGDSEEFPYHALVNEQAWLPFDGDVIRTTGTDAVRSAWDGRTVDELDDTVP